MFLQEPFQRAGAVYRVVALLGDKCLGGIRQLDGQLLVRQTAVYILYQQADDAADILLRERLKENGLVQTV